MKISLFLLALVLSSTLYAIEFSGVIEAEYGYTKDYTEKKASDIVVATAELGLTHKVTKKVDGTIVFLYEEDGTFEVDQAFIVGLPFDSFTVTAGMIVIPFGSFSSNMIADPLTLEMAETKETALMGTYEMDALSFSIYAFNGTNTRQSEKEGVDTYGLAFAYSLKSSVEFEFKAGYITNMLDSNLISEKIVNAATHIYTEKVAAYSLEFQLKKRCLSFIGEYLTASEKAALADLPFKGKGAKIGVMRFELGYQANLNSIGLSYQKTSEAFILALPETRMAVAYSRELNENNNLGLEYSMDDDYKVVDDGTGKDGYTVTAKWAIGF